MFDHALTAFFDGACPLCRREARFIQRRDKANRIRFVDIAATDFDPAVYGFTRREVDHAIHAITPDGRVLRGMEVFRAIYRELGMGWLLGWTGWPILRPLADAAYWLFARHIRPRLPGRCTDGSCSLPGR